jgi:PadR family transcriptional regulator, regulatory protein PadR
MKISKDLVAASAVPIVLSILEEGESYGYAILLKVRDISDGEFLWSDGMLYPVLHRLEKMNFIEARWGEADSGRKRKYYRLARAGKAALNEQKKQWRVVVSSLEKLWGFGHV